jgi:hypothetical protein
MDNLRVHVQSFGAPDPENPSTAAENPSPRRSKRRREPTPDKDSSEVKIITPPKKLWNNIPVGPVRKIFTFVLFNIVLLI